MMHFTANDTKDAMSPDLIILISAQPVHQFNFNWSSNPENLDSFVLEPKGADLHDPHLSDMPPIRDVDISLVV